MIEIHVGGAAGKFRGCRTALFHRRLVTVFFLRILAVDRYVFF